LLRKKQKNAFYEKCHSTGKVCPTAVSLQEAEKCILRKAPHRLGHMQCR
jgi:hypothetical protein